MTTRLIIGIDPGVSGAIAVLADGRFAGVYDTPVRARRSGRQEIDGYGFRRLICELEGRHQGAVRAAVIEDVNAMPPRRDTRKPLKCQKCGADSGHYDEVGMGATSAFQFGRSAAAVQYILEALGFSIEMVVPAKWKRDTGLLGSNKDYARTVASQCYPMAAKFLERKKDDGRAEALLLARWGEKHRIDLVKHSSTMAPQQTGALL